MFYQKRIKIKNEGKKGLMLLIHLRNLHILRKNSNHFFIYLIPKN